MPTDIPSRARTETGTRSVSFDYSYNPKTRNWGNTKAISKLRAILDGGITGYATALDAMTSFSHCYEKIPVEQPTNAQSPYWANGWMPGLDAISLYWLLASRNPRRYIEIGSGNSTKFARRAIEDHGLRTKITSIDPHPRAEIDLICDAVERRPLEDVDGAFFDNLTNEDLLFLDSSHRSFQNSDVTVFFMEILPALQSGTVVGIHDIFLPEDYITAWEDRFYNEQYLLAAYIFGGMDGGKILLPNWYITKTPDLIRRLQPVWMHPLLKGIQPQGGAFWMIK